MKWKAILFCIIASAWIVSASAQHTSRFGRFEVDQVKGCAPLTITVTPIAPCDNDNPCAAFYENSTTSEPLITPPFTHTYTQPGSYNLKILRGVLYDSIRIDVAPNIAPAFDVYTCGNNEVSVKIKDDNYDEYVINYNDGTPEVVVSPLATNNHTYGSSTPQTISVRGRDLNAGDNCDVSVKSVTPLPTLPPPTITLLEVLDNNSIRLEMNTQENIQYKLGIATNSNTTFQQVKTIYNQSVDTVFNLNTDDNYYCFQLAAFDPCNNRVFNSSVICSANLDVSVRNNAIDVGWVTSSTGVSNFRLTRNAADGSVLVTAPPASPYTDSGVACGMEYCYQLTNNYSNGSRSVSLRKCGTGFSTDIPPAIDNITAIVGDNSVVLEWQTDPDFTPAQFSIEKSIRGDYSPLSTTTQHAFSDSEYNLEDESCYRISYTDVCNNASPVSLEACPIRLTGNLQKDNSIALSWTPYAGWTQGVASYTIEKYAEDGTLLATFPTGMNTSYLDETDDLDHQLFLYVVKASPAEPGLVQSGSNRISILKDPNLFHPTAFTPNGDNLNDIFTVYGQYVVDFEMKIFNRWGELLFTTDDIHTGWDGTYRGNEMPEGTYAFIAHVTDRTGRTFKRTGSVLLLRKRE